MILLREIKTIGTFQVEVPLLRNPDCSSNVSLIFLGMNLSFVSYLMEFSLDDGLWDLDIGGLNHREILSRFHH